MKWLVTGVMLMHLNVPLGVWDVAAPWVNNACGCASGGAQDQGRALVTVSCWTEVALTCADLAINKAVVTEDARRAKR